MKGVIDLRVADILAKQAAMQHHAAVFQSGVAQHEADKAALYTARAEASEAAAASGGSPAEVALPHSSTWYGSNDISLLDKGEYLPSGRDLPDPVEAGFGMSSATATITLGRRVGALSYSNFI